MAALPLRAHLFWRSRRGAEIKARLGERRGLSTLSLPASALRVSSWPAASAKKPLLWIHASSVGETKAAFPLIDALLRHDASLTLLMTTATVAGAQTLSAHSAYGQRLFHQFSPLDVSDWSNRFLDRWLPVGVVFVENDLWPGLLVNCEARGIPVMLVNGRLSARSFRRWKRARPIAAWMFGKIRWISPRSRQDSFYFQGLGAPCINAPADLKRDAASLPVSRAELTHLRQALGERPVFVAASTHPGEEELIVEALILARKRLPTLLGILVPRHPARGAALAQRFEAPRRSAGEFPEAQTPLWIADTLGELGLFYGLARCAFIGNSLCAPGGGHNPYEPLRLGCAVSMGPWRQDWEAACRTLDLPQVTDAQTLATWIVTSQTMPSPPLLQREATAEPLALRILDTIRLYSPPS